MMNSERLTLQDVVDLLAEKQKMTKKDAESFLREWIAIISETIEQKDFVRIKDFGTFKLTAVKPRKSVDVNSKEAIEIPAHYRLNFTPDKILRDRVNRPFSHFESVLLEDDVVFEDKKIETRTLINPESEIEEEVLDSIVEKADTLELEEIVAVVEEPNIEVQEIEEIIEEELESPKQEKVEKESEFEEEKDIEIAEELIVEEKLELELESAVDSKEVIQEKLEEIHTTVDELQEEEFIVGETIEEAQIEALEEQVSSLDLKEKDEEVVFEHERLLVKPVYNPSEVDDEEDDYETTLEKEKKGKRNIWITMAIAVIVAVVLFYFWNSYNSEGDSTPTVDSPSIIISDPEESQTVQPNAEAPGEVMPVVNEASEQTVEDEEPVVTVPDTTTPTQPEQGAREVVVKMGQSMRKLGKEYYGHQAFWVYIFEENRGTINTPDDIQAGMTITIAPASKYEIDPNDPASVAKAERLETKLFSEFSKN